jgi:hypothetical protein
MVWGVEPHRRAFDTASEGLIHGCEEILRHEGLFRSGREVVLAAGRIPGVGISSVVKIHTLS